MSGFYEFFKAAVKSPLQTSTFVESGPRVGRRFARHLHLRPDQVVVELGVGAGAITEHILDALDSPSQYVGFELNDSLHRFLSQEKFPNLEIHHKSADTLVETLKGRKVGAVISTLPWSLIPKEVRQSILSQVHEVLEPGGTFSVFLALHMLWTPSVRDFWNTLTEKFPDYTYTDEMWNMPPCRMYFARKH